MAPFLLFDASIATSTAMHVYLHSFYGCCSCSPSAIYTWGFIYLFATPRIDLNLKHIVVKCFIEYSLM